MFKSKSGKDISLLANFFDSNISKIMEKDINRHIILYHYTSLSTLFKILENDSLQLSNLKFTNDSSEGKILGEKWLDDNGYKGNDFIFCITKMKDLLSQWRGYCPDGGVSIGFDIADVRRYSVLHADYEKSRKVKDMYGIALPVLYTSYEDEDVGDRNIYIGRIRGKLKMNPQYSLHIKEFVPYIKSKAFEEEQEHRLLFSNNDGELSRCIRFRPAPNGVQLPYIVVKCGCINEHRKRYLKMSGRNLIYDKNRKTLQVVIVPDCSNQEQLYDCVREHIKNDEKLREDEGEVRVFCEGHLPIRSIMIGPMPDQNRIKEQVEYYCQSKYWLKDVEVTTSTIPYVSSMYK